MKPVAYNLSKRFDKRGNTMDKTMMSIADYARTRRISQTAVRKQIARYEEELKEHIFATNRRRMLDDVAISFLDSHRMSRDIIIEQADEVVRQELEESKKKIELMNEKMMKLYEAIVTLQQENRELIASSTKSSLLLEMKTEESESLKSQMEEAKKEAESYQKTVFGLYRKMKK